MVVARSPTPSSSSSSPSLPRTPPPKPVFNIDLSLDRHEKWRLYEEAIYRWQISWVGTSVEDPRELSCPPSPPSPYLELNNPMQSSGSTTIPRYPASPVHMNATSSKITGRRRSASAPDPPRPAMKRSYPSRKRAATLASIAEESRLPLMPGSFDMSVHPDAP